MWKYRARARKCRYFTVRANNLRVLRGTPRLPVLLLLLLLLLLFALYLHREAQSVIQVSKLQVDLLNTVKIYIHANISAEAQ